MGTEDDVHHELELIIHYIDHRRGLKRVNDDNSENAPFSL
jgi:hypothetical protein